MKKLLIVFSYKYPFSICWRAGRRAVNMRDWNPSPAWMATTAMCP